MKRLIPLALFTPFLASLTSLEIFGELAIADSYNYTNDYRVPLNAIVTGNLSQVAAKAEMPRAFKTKMRQDMMKGGYYDLYYCASANRNNEDDTETMLRTSVKDFLGKDQAAHIKPPFILDSEEEFDRLKRLSEERVAEIESLRQKMPRLWPDSRCSTEFSPPKSRSNSLCD